MPVTPLNRAISAIPPGAWAIGVSGGADSVALLMLLRERADLRLHVAHLDHETRGAQSTADAAFVKEVCRRNAISCTIARRSELEPLAHDLPANRSARFRALRFALFQTICKANDLQGVILAHHAGDQVETIFQRLLRGSGPAGLCGMRSRTRVNGLVVIHPLLDIAPQDLREFLKSHNQPWREDASNASTAYQRNRVRMVLRGHPALSESVGQMGEAMNSLAAWTRSAAPVLRDEFTVCDLENCPEALGQTAARQWLAEQGVPRHELTPPVINRLLEMARDAATPPRQHFPGGILLARRKGRISAMKQPETKA